MPTFGLRSQFAFVIGAPHEEWPTTGTREVDIYAAGHWLTCDDSNVYVPTFASSLKAEIDLLLDNSACTKLRRPDPSLSIAENHRRLCAAANAGDNAEYLAYRFMDWGETTDNVIAHLFLEDGVASIPFSFWRKEHHDPAELGEVFVAELPERELLRLIHETAWTLALGLR